MAPVSAVLLLACYRPFFQSWVAWVALVPIFWGLRKCRPAMAFWPAWLFMSLVALWGTKWFVIIDRFNSLVWFGIPPLALYGGFYFAVACALIVYFGRKLPPWGALGAGMLCWSGIEYFFGIGPLGMPYGLGQSQGGWLAMAHVASLGGTPLIAALIVGMNLAVMENIAAFRAGYGQGGALARLGAMLALAILGCLYGAGVMSARERELAEGPTFKLRVALMQPGISQDKKYLSYTSPDEAERRRLQDELTMTQLTQLRTIERGEFDLIVTPESTFTQEFIDVEEVFQRRQYGGAIMLEVIDLAKDLETPIVIGGLDNVFRNADGDWTESLAEGIDSSGELRPGEGAYGGLWLVRPADEGIRMAADYRKVQLMPFGESVPYLSIIPGFQEKIVQVGSFRRGRLAAPVGFFVEDSEGVEHEVRLGPSICFEDQFAHIHRGHASRGANLFVNTTNDAWFDGSAGPAWHGDMARWRSIETGIPMVRATNTGITCVIDSVGRVTEKLPLLEHGILKTELVLASAPLRSWYTILGPWYGVLALWGTVGLLVWLARRRERAA